MRNRGRFISIAVFASLATIVGATLSWACTPATFGTPATPAAPPAPANTESVPTPSAPAAITAPAASNPAPASTGTSGSGSTSGAPARVRTPVAAPRSNAVAPRVVAPSTQQQRTGVVANRTFAQRASGGTVGTTTSRAGQPVFARSAAPAKKAAKAAGEARTAPSTRSAAGDLWSGFEPAERSSVLQASAAGQDEGVNGTAAAALAFLGIGLTGIAGAAAFLALRGRRAKSRSAVSSNGTTEI